MVELKNSTATIKLNTGAELPVVGLGTWQSTDEDCYKAVLAALKNGYKHIDTAAIYGNEEVIGRAIKDSGIPREELFITTKLWFPGYRNPKEALTKSLERLGLDYVDLYLIHWPATFKEGQDPIHGNAEADPSWTHVHTWRMVQKLPETGLTKAVGVSNFTINNLKDILNDPENKVIPAANQVEIHPYLPQEDLFDFCKEKGIVIEAYSPLGSTGSPAAKEPVIVELAEKYGVAPAQVLISWVISRGMVVLPKSQKEERVIANFKVFQLEKSDIERINEVHKKSGTKRFVDPPFSLGWK
ncbi:HFL252Cp [Eremothecium sinecaudum]|uniref:HFL252Cp n=1 Tax=Eremothecium sinecaudum TaxID=45286 RepID=A0A0X8HUC2_9SACH|nr:HFL252Cp [Eremothecium sinecaudum]AMD21604.1 HFL252Cp [Eremothecium sinecaudum]